MEEIELLGRKLEREQAARAQAESILEKKSLELYAANEALRQLNERLETTIQERTADLDRIAKQYRQIVENVSDLIYRADAIGTITYINQVAFVKFGYTEAEVIGKRFTAFIHPDFRTKVIKFYQEVFQKGQPQSYFEFPILDKWGKTVWLGQNVQLLKKGEQIDQVFAVARDITARKAAEIELSHAQRRLRESEEKYRGIMENMELGLLEVDVEQNILRAYDSFCEMTGYTSDELIGQNAEEIFIVPAFKSVIQAEDRDRRTGKSSVYEVQIKHKNGRPIWVLISGAPIYDSAGKMVGSIGIHYDITNRKMLEEELRQAKEVAEEARAAEQQFLARMSHEIRTPLNAIVGMTHLLYDTQPSSEQQEYLTVLKRSADILTGLISDILDFSKIQAGEMKVVKQPLDLPGLVQSMRKTFSLQFENRPVAVRANIDQRITNLLLGDELLLSQVLLNLLGNAAKFTQAGFIAIHLEVVQEEADFQTIRFRVQDTGIGIAPDKLKLIFESFKQASPDVQQKFGGTGLGLAISRQLVELLGGSLEVESELDQGTTFSFTLTFENTGTTIPSAAPTFLQPSVQDQQSIHILVAEDNTMNRKYIATLLTKWNYSYDMALNGREAVEHARKSKYDLILMDISMPEMNGYEATIKIRNAANPNQDTPIVALTASALKTMKKKALQIGMTDFMTKPFQPKQLEEMIQVQVFAKANPTEEARTEAFSFHHQLDSAQLLAFYENDLEYAIEMFETFLDYSVKEFEALETLLHAPNLDKAARQAHKVKPGFNMVGLSYMAEDLDLIEKMIRQNAALSEIEAVYLQLKAILADRIPLLQAELNRMKQYIG